MDLGVPQGSKLGPLLFLIYINDIKDAIKRMGIKLFWDDTLTYYWDHSIDKVLEVINEELRELKTWLKKNKLKLNIMKTKYLIMGKNIDENLIENEIKIDIDGEIIERVKNIKYLGVIIDENLNWDEHFRVLVSKFQGKINFLWRYKNVLNWEGKKLLYNAFVGSVLNYCASILFELSGRDLDKLQKSQNDAMRNILGWGRRVRIIDMLEKLGWLCIELWVKYRTFITIFKMKSGIIRELNVNTLKVWEAIHDHKTRKGGLGWGFDRRGTIDKMIFYKGIRDYNKCYELEGGKLEVFKNKLKGRLMKYQKAN